MNILKRSVLFLLSIQFIGALVVAQTRAIRQEPPMTYYIGDDIRLPMTIIENNRVQGIESFERRYGTNPSILGSVAKNNITESFFLMHKKPSDTVYIYIQGIGDSAYQGKDIARFLFEKGVDVLSVRLSGHGIDSGNINNVTIADWRNDIDQAVNLAKKTGKKVILAALSLGADIAIDKAYRTPEEVSGVIAIAPAIGMANSIAGLLKNTGLFDITAKLFPYVGREKLTQTEIRQVYKGAGSVGVLYDLEMAIQSHLNGGDLLKPPLLLVSSTGDQAIDPKWLSKMMKVARDGQWLQFVKDPQLDGEKVVRNGNITQVFAPEVSPHNGLIFDPAYAVHQEDAAVTTLETGQQTRLPFGDLGDTNPGFPRLLDAITEFHQARLGIVRCARVLTH